MSCQVPDIVFLFDYASLPWLFTEEKDLLAEMFLMPYIYSIDRVVIEYDASTLELKITGDAEDNTISLDGKRLDADERDRFGDLYRFLISAKGEELFTDDEDSDELIVKITYHYRDNSQSTDVVEYHKDTSADSDNRRSIIRLNGENVYKIRNAYTTRLINNIEAFINGENIILDW